MGSQAKIIELLKERYDVDAARLSPDAKLVDLGLDSIAMASLIMDLEDEFDISIGLTAAKIETLGETVALVDRLRQANEMGG